MVCFNLSIKYIIFFSFKVKAWLLPSWKKAKSDVEFPPNHGIINQLGVSFGLYEYSCSTCWHVTGHCGQRLAPLTDRVELEVLELLSVLILLSLFQLRTYREIMAHSFLVLLVCTSRSCDNSICSVSSSMNYGWTPQPLSVVGIYVDRAAFCSVTPPFCVKGSVWIWKRSEREKKIKVICSASKQSILLTCRYSRGGRLVIDCWELKPISCVHPAIEPLLTNN